MKPTCTSLRARASASIVAVALPLLLLCAVGCSSDQAVGSLPDGGQLGDGARSDGQGGRGDGSLGDGPRVDGTLGDSSGTDGGYNSGGGGNGALFVDATVSASEERNNASVAGDFKAEITVVVKRAGAAVTDAKVTITSTLGVVTLQHDGQGSYSGQQVGYARRYQLDVTAGSDSVTGVRAEGPAIHTIDAPKEGERHKAGQPLEVRWTAGKATEVTVETADMPRATTSDSGSFTVNGSFLAGDAGKEKDDRVRVRRSNVQTISGGTAGSDFTVRLRNQVEFVVDAT